MQRGKFSKKLSTNSYEIFARDGTYVSLATSHSILLCIRIMIGIQEFLTKFLPFRRNIAKSKSFVRSATLAEVCDLRVLLFLIALNISHKCYD